MLGHRLELVPRQDPFAVPRGQSLTIAVLFDGKPLAGEAVFIFGENDADATEQVTSNASGEIRLPITRSGRFLVSTEHDAPSRHPDLATRDAYAASLVFTRP